MSRPSTLRSFLRARAFAALLAGASAFAAIATITPDAAAQCAMCKESAYDQHDQGLSNRLGRGFNASVYSMLGVPAALLVGLVVLIRRNLRAQSRNQAPPPGES